MKIAVDEQRDMDISFGEEYRGRHKIQTYFTPNTIRADERLNRLADVILNDAIESKAADIHINQWSDKGVVSFRLGNDMVDVRHIHKHAVDGLITVLRHRAEVSLEDIYKPEISGRITHRFGNKDYDIRTSFLPAMHGQSAVLRILYASQLDGHLDALGFPDNMVVTIKRTLNLDEGLVLLTGGTGSGKTTTLYTAIQHIVNEYQKTKSIYAVENPVEYTIDGVVQVSTDELRGVTFGKVLQAFLRSDPNIILVGEVNDDTTASTVVRASSTGHLVFSTIHSNNTLEVYNALLQLGVNPLDLGTALKLVIYQTLQPQLCQSCRIHTPVTVQENKWIKDRLLTNKPLINIYQRNKEGCPECRHKGVKGRVLLAELLEGNRSYKRGIDETNRDLYKLKEYLMSDEYAGFYPLEWDVFRHLEAGNIDMETAYRLIN